MNTKIEATVIVGIIIVLIFIIGKNIHKYIKSKKGKNLDTLTYLRQRCREEQERLEWIHAKEAVKRGDITTLVEMDVSGFSEERIRYTMVKIASAIKQLGGQEIKHPDAISRAGSLTDTITRLRSGNEKTSRAGRARTQSAKQGVKVVLSPEQRSRF